MCIEYERMKIVQTIIFLNFKIAKEKRNSNFADTMKKNILFTVIILVVSSFQCAQAQLVKGNFDQIKTSNFNPGYEGQSSRWNEVEDDTTEVSSTEDVPEGIYAWKVEPTFGTIIPAAIDTLMHGFPNESSTKGRFGGYLTTGNLGAPRKSMRLDYNKLNAWNEQFIFLHPYDFFAERADNQLFTNTKSPFTNITYHECGDKEHGEDRITALFAVNSGKKLGMGFNIDYLYGRGYYQFQNTAHFMGNIYASYLGDRYTAHTAYRLQYLKTTENGGLEDDRYITEPEALSNSYETWDMPTNLSKVWNKLNINSFLFTQRVHIGKLETIKNSISKDSINTDTVGLPENRVSPLTLSHSIQIDHDDRLFLSNSRSNALSPHYFKDYFFEGDSACDKTKHYAIRNTIAIELNEQWKKWLRAGAKIYATHKHEYFTLPNTPTTYTSYRYNYFTLGTELTHQKGKILDYDFRGEIRTRDGSRWGEFKLQANGALQTQLWNDTLKVSTYAHQSSEEPSFYYRHYQSRNAWWNQEALNNVFTTKLGVELKYKTTKFSVQFEQINDGAYFQETLYEPLTPTAANAKLHSVKAIQNGKPVQRLEVDLYNLATFGIFNWENQLTYQTTSDKSLSPVPAFIAYTNLFLKFKIANVLNTELGADMRFYTRFTPQVYSPIIGQYVLQDVNHAEKVGGYPIINVYANMHLKRTRFYIMASHINASERQRKAFELPHYPMNGMTIHLGVSWNFIN